jgi:hypothetical protein
VRECRIKMPDFSRFNKFMTEFMPILMRDESTRKQALVWLQNELKKIEARRAADEALIERREQEAILKGAFNPEYFKEAINPAMSYLEHLQTVRPDLTQGYNIPQTIGNELREAEAAAARVMMRRMSEEPQDQADLELLARFAGMKPLEETTAETVGVREAERERKGREEQRKLEWAKLPIEEESVKARWAEIRGQVSSMTPKEARAELARLGVERRRYQAMLETKEESRTENQGQKEMLDMSEFFPSVQRTAEQINHIKDNIEEIKRLENEIKTKVLKEKLGPDEFGLVFNEVRVSPKDGRKYRYVGNNHWVSAD